MKYILVIVWLHASGHSLGDVDIAEFSTKEKCLKQLSIANNINNGIKQPILKASCEFI